MRINEKLQLRRKSLKILASQIWIVFLSTTTAMAGVPGHGSPQGFEYCNYNADPVRTYKPSNVVKAEKALELAEKHLKRAKEDLDNADPCESTKCHHIFKKVIELTVGKKNLHSYSEYLRGDFKCYIVANSAIRHYNMYAQVYGWDVIQEETLQIDPQRTIANSGEIGKSDDASPGASDDAPSGTAAPVPEASEDKECPYMGFDQTLNTEICDDASEKENSSRNYTLSSCKRCFGPNEPGYNKYGRCLKERDRLEQVLHEAQNLVDTRKTEKNNAEKKPSSTTVCTDCMQDTRSWWEKWGPTLLTGGIVGLTGYFGYRQERNSYKHYRDVIHENNNRLGYPTEPRDDLSGYRLAAHLVNGAPLVLNTGLSTGAFGCAGSSMYGAGSVLSGIFGGAQQGGANGYNSNILNGLSGNVSGILNGGTNGLWGTSPPSAAQIDATIRAQQESIARQQAQLAILQQNQNYYQSRAAIERDALARIQRLPQPTSTSSLGVWNQSSGVNFGNSNNFLSSFFNHGQVSGGVQINGQVSTYGNAGTSWGSPQSRSSTSRSGVVPILD